MPVADRLHDYADVQRELATMLSEESDRGWMTSAEQLREGTYESGGGFSEVLPLVLVCCDGPDSLDRAKAILNGRPKYEHDWLESQRMDGKAELDADRGL
jgi:hypothetical protein